MGDRSKEPTPPYSPFDEMQLRALRAESEAVALREALREIMAAARDLTTWRSDDALLVHIADLAARALVQETPQEEKR